MLRHLLVFIVVILVSGCAGITEPLGMEDPFAIPHPFEGVGRNQTALNPAFGLVTMKVEVAHGMEPQLASELQSRLVRELDERDIATQSDPSTADWILKGRATRVPTNEKNGVERRVIIWRLFDAARKPHQQFAVQYTGSNAGDVSPRVSELAKQVAERVDSIISPQNQSPAVAGGSAGPVRMFIGEIRGATGDGNQVLTQRIKTALERKSYSVVVKMADTDWQIECDVEVKPLSPTQDQVKLVWKLYDAKHKEAGTLTQQNPVPKGRLAKNWGDIADFAAQGAAEGMQQILQQIRTGRAN